MAYLAIFELSNYFAVLNRVSGVLKLEEYKNRAIDPKPYATQRDDDSKPAHEEDKDGSHSGKDIPTDRNANNTNLNAESDDQAPDNGA